jgi:hypothetical protein
MIDTERERDYTRCSGGFKKEKNFEILKVNGA